MKADEHPGADNETDLNRICALQEDVQVPVGSSEKDILATNLRLLASFSLIEGTWDILTTEQAKERDGLTRKLWMCRK